MTKGQTEELLTRIEAKNCDEESLKAREKAIYELAEVYLAEGLPRKVMEFVEQRKECLESFSKPKAAKILRVLIEKLEKVPGSEPLQIEMCKNLIQWCEAQKRTYLKHRIIMKLSGLLLATGNPLAASEIIQPIFAQVRKADDKHLLVQLNLLDSKINFSLEKYAKSKASLTSARANANQVYCSPVLMADIDNTAGTLYAEEKDYKTSYSYFFQAFEGFSSANDSRALSALKYMLLCKVMKGTMEEVTQILTGKHGIKYASRDLSAMQQLARANQAKSVQLLKTVLREYDSEIKGDKVLGRHIEGLYERLVEQNLHLVIEPYSRVQLSHIAETMSLDEHLIQTKLSEMILDRKINGTLDQGLGCLVIYKDSKQDNLFPSGLKQLESLSGVVDKLFVMVQAQKNTKH